VIGNPIPSKNLVDTLSEDDLSFFWLEIKMHVLKEFMVTDLNGSRDMLVTEL